NRMCAVWRETFDGEDRFADSGRCGNAAGAHHAAVHVQRAGTALSDAAGELRARQPDVFADHPEERRLRVRIDRMSRAVDGQLERHSPGPASAKATAGK